jgi:hypothetical protein
MRQKTREETMDDLQKVLALQEIQQVKARRCRCVDLKDWAGYIDCHTPDAVSYALSSPTVGAEAMARQLEAQIGGKTTVHHVHSPEIEFTSDTTAKGIWAMEDMLWWEENGQKYWTHGYGHYYETYENRDGRWLISSRKLERIRVDTGRAGEPDLMRAAR